METTPKPALTLPAKEVGWSLALERAPLSLSILSIFCIPFLNQPLSADPFYVKWALTQVLVYLIFCVWTFRAFLKGRLAWVQTTATRPLAVLLGWLALTLLVSPYGAYGWSAFREWLVFPLWYLLLTQTCLEVWKAENLLVVFLGVGLGCSGMALGQALGLTHSAMGDQAIGLWGVSAGFGKADHLAGYLLMVWPIALALFLRARMGLTRLIWSGILVLSLIAMLFTGSRPGWLGLITGALVYGFGYFLRGKMLKPLLGVAVIATATIAVSLFVPALHQRIGDIVKAPNGPDWIRASVWKGSVEMVHSRPWTGCGFGSFRTAFPASASFFPSRPRGSVAIPGAANVNFAACSCIAFTTLGCW